MINGNLSSTFFLCKNLIPAMRRQGFGRIITFGYDRAEQATDQYYRGPYASAKTGLVSLTRTLAIEERPHGITTNMICPGDIRKKEKDAAIHGLFYNKQIHSENPCRAIIDTVDLFLSPASQELNGTIISVNGGKNIFHEIDLPNFPKEEASFSKGTWVLVHPWDLKKGKIIGISKDYYGRTLFTIQDETEEVRGEFTHYQIQKIKKEDFLI
jgi:3-oxoacyl-[acyl-carrier protein] reductase